MAVSVNRVMLAGNLTRDPNVKFFANERAVADFGMAMNRRFRGADGEQKEEVTFVDVEAWGRTAELVGQYLTKGRACLIEGRLRLDQWEDKQSGAKRSRLKVVADTVQFLDGPQRDGGGGAGGYASSGPRDDDQRPAGGGGSSAGAADPQPAYDDDEPPF